MIIFINGSFGVGKTTVAELLVERLPNSMLYDPELVGTILRMMTDGIREGVEDTDDFQDIALWRPLAVEFAARLRQTYGRTLIIPMTVTRLDYFAELTQGLTAVDSDFHHFCLRASAETIRARLMQRGEKPDQWVFHQIERCQRAHAQPEFSQHIDTDNVSANEIADGIVKNLTHDA